MAAPDVTALLRSWADGDTAAFDRLVPLVYRELHKIARTCMAAERSGHSLQPTALLHEAYLRLARVTEIEWQDRAHFFAMSAKMMRRILVDVARRKRYLKRGGGAVAEPLDHTLAVTDERAPVTLLEPEHPAMNTPNRITAADFDGWVQERGLYFPDQWDERFTPILASGDPGETPLQGGLLVARLGKGHLVYTSLSWFRQLPEGVPGAYRLFANLVSLSQ